VLDDISFKKITINDFDHVHLTRLNNEFEPVLNLCKLFISQSSVELSVDKIDTFSFIFDMNALFEKFIGEFIKREFSDIYDTITLQGPRRWFVKNKVVDNEGMGVAFQMRPDIVLEKKGPPAEKLIIDTKYKLLQRQDKKEGVSQSDLYQMHAYATRYLCTNFVMLYPQFERTAKSFDFQIDQGPIVHIRMINLCRNLKKEKEKLRNDSKDILDEVSPCEIAA